MVVRRFPGIDPIISPNLPIIALPLSHWSANRGYAVLQGTIMVHHLYLNMPNLRNILLINFCNHLWEPKVSFLCSLPIRTLFICIYIYWLSFDMLPVKLVVFYRKCLHHHPLRRSKPSAAWNIYNRKNPRETPTDTILPCLTNVLYSTLFLR